MDSRWARVGRGTAAAAFATFVAALSHTLAGGSAPSLFGMLVCLVISAMVCTMLTGRALSAWRLAASVAISQLLFHALFSGLGTPVVVEHHTGTMAMDAAPVHLHSAPTMWLAHAAAGLVTIVVFRYAESAFWGVADTARLFLARLFAVVLPRLTTPPRVVVVAVERLARDLTLFLSPMRHRGPPLGSSAL